MIPVWTLVVLQARDGSWLVEIDLTGDGIADGPEVGRGNTRDDALLSAVDTFETMRIRALSKVGETT